MFPTIYLFTPQTLGPVCVYDIVFNFRLSLPSEWCGLRDSELTEKCGVPHCIFVHASGFIGGNDSYEGVLKMAQKSLRRNFGGLEAVFH